MEVVEEEEEEVVGEVEEETEELEVTKEGEVIKSAISL